VEYARLVRDKVGRDVEFSILGEYRTGDNRHSVSSISKLQSLGWTPSQCLADILEDFIDWIRGTGGVPESVPDAYLRMKQSGVVLAARN
jgi:nucleoside-diphosphate-sugar epimerase